MKLSVIFVVLALAAATSAVVIQQGDKGPDVFGLQYLLNARGMNLGVDGDFGPGTKSGVISFQNSRGLTATGKVNIQTFNVLIADVSRGSTNRNRVKAAQYLLKHKWYTYTSSVDGLFGSGTETSVKSFQYSKSLVNSGVVNADTWTALFSSQTGTGGGGGGSDRQSLAQQILNHSSITLADVHVAQYSSAVNSARYYDSTAYKNVLHQSQGTTPYTSCYGNAPCSRADLSITMMNCLLSAANGMSVSISSLVGSSHSATSKHYNGWAMDINYVNGVHVSPSGAGLAGSLAFSAVCTAFGATLVLNPVNEPQYHHNHVHCQWNTSN